MTILKYNNATDDVFGEVSKVYVKVSDFMSTAMNNSPESYYLSQVAIGRDEDFITSPEVSQMFGEMVGVWSYQQWNQIDEINIVELGPGKGTLMRDLVRSIKHTRMIEHVKVYFYDINPILKPIQISTCNGIDITFIDSLDDLPKSACIIIANEFFDALQLDQYVKDNTVWHERVISNHRGEYGFDINYNMSYNFPEHKNAKNGAILEISDISCDYMQKLVKHLKFFGGSLLIIDYGYCIPPHERRSDQYLSTIQGVYKHKYHDIFSRIGGIDISAHVDFYRLMQIANQSEMHTLMCTQREFLHAMGIKTRKETLKLQHKTDHKIIDAQYHRLTHNSQMGELFKVLTCSYARYHQ
jgi:SAM-dependent MidA family methyltransferase